MPGRGTRITGASNLIAAVRFPQLLRLNFSDKTIASKETQLSAVDQYLTNGTLAGQSPTVRTGRAAPKPRSHSEAG